MQFTASTATVRRTLRSLAAGALAGALLPALAAAPGAQAASAPAAGSAAATAATNSMVVGVSASGRAEVEAHERALGKLGGVHYYRKWDSNLFGKDQLWMRDSGHTLFVAIRSERERGSKIAWRDVAAARPGSSLHDDMLRHAREIKAFGKTVWITYNHEPDAHLAASMGTPTDYVAAWRKVVSTYRAAGATNARFAFNTTAFGFSRKDGKNARYYYPGDDYVDSIASDAYNWYGCRPGQSWRTLREALEGHRAFGALHPTKQLMVMEFGSGEDSKAPGRKGQWLREAAALFQSPGWGQFTAAMYWPGRNFQGDDGNGCMDYTTSSTALSGMREFVARSR